MAEHTPTPYRVHAEPLDRHPEYHIYHIVCDHGTVCTIDTSNEEQDAANAAYIVRACNAHEALLAALELAITCMECGEPKRGQSVVEAGGWGRIIDRCRTAIAAAGGDA